MLKKKSSNQTFKQQKCTEEFWKTLSGTVSQHLHNKMGNKSKKK